MTHWLKTLWRNLTHKQMIEEDLTQELYSYQAMLVEEKVARRNGSRRGAACRPT